MPEHTTELTVRSYELDPFDHVNHAVYLNYLEQARWESLAAGGFPASLLKAQDWAIHVVRLEVEYRKPCFQDQRLRVRTRTDHVRKTAVTLAQSIFRIDDGPDADPAVRALVTTVFMGADGRPMRIPEQARRALGI